MATGGGFLRRVGGFVNGGGAGSAMAGSRSAALRKTAAGIVKASATSGCLMALGDGIRQLAIMAPETENNNTATKERTQAISSQEEIRNRLTEIDVKQMARFGLIGTSGI